MSPPEEARETENDAERSDPFDADTAIIEGRALPSHSVPLDRYRIIAAATTYVDEQGLPGLSMRRLGAALGVEAMSLYRYVTSKEELLDGMVDALIAELRHDEAVLDQPEHGWQDFLQRLAYGIRRIALTHPKVFPLIASRPPEAPWLRPPLRSIEWVEVFLTGMSSEGFMDDAAVHAYRAFTSFLLGHLLLEAATLGADTGPLDVVEDPQQAITLSSAPMVQRLRAELATDHSAAAFDEALEQLLERLALLKSEQ